MAIMDSNRDSAQISPFVVVKSPTCIRVDGFVTLSSGSLDSESE
jgi:hypothetical protein